jgi:hypothetical protein
MKHGTPLVQRSLARLVGVVNWNINSPILSKGINYLLDRVQSSVSNAAAILFIFAASPLINITDVDYQG